MVEVYYASLLVSRPKLSPSTRAMMIDVRTDADDFLLVEDLSVLAMVVLTLVSDLHHPIRRE